MGALRRLILCRAEEQPVTRGWLARELNRDRSTILKALRSLVRRGLLQRRRVQVRWPGDYVTSVDLYYTPASRSRLPAIDEGDASKLVDPAGLPCLAEAYHRRKEAMDALQIMRNRP